MVPGDLRIDGHRGNGAAVALDRRMFLGGGLALALAACSGARSRRDPVAAGSSVLQTSATLPPLATSQPASGGDSATSSPSSGSVGAGLQEPARFVTSGREGGRNPRPEVALTFHTNGDLGLARRLVEILASHEARATCFIVGNWLEANPSWASKLLDGGHELANHTYSHPDFASLTPQAMVDEIARCRDVIARLTGDGGRYFRPSGTDDGLARPSDTVMTAAARAGYTVVVGWDVEPFDYKDPGPAAVQDRVLAGVQAGSIVSLHFGHPGTVESLAGILGGLAAKGLRPVTVSELLA